MGKLYPCHKKQTKNPAETTGNRYKIEILMSRTQKLKGLSAASLRLKALNDNPYYIRNMSLISQQNLQILVIYYIFTSIEIYDYYAGSYDYTCNT